ncbi:MAG: pectinesterase family protein [Cruoricaptor ignavus]|nr:pectinesterase family protein [Cruoricaptor ignavus]
MKRFLLLIIMVFALPQIKSQKTDVWDFGATQLDTSVYNNLLSESVINSWYNSSVTPGSSGSNNTMPTSFTAGDLSWKGGGNDRLRTINTAITRYDQNIAGVSGYDGRVYCNATTTLSDGLPTLRYYSIYLKEDDKIQIVARTDSNGLLTIVYAENPTLQTETFPITSASGSVTSVDFVAKRAGLYYFYDSTAKLSIYRVYRKNAEYVQVSGTVNVEQASDIGGDYNLVFTNTAGKTWQTTISGGVYNVSLPIGETYNVGLQNANDYIVAEGDVLELNNNSPSVITHNIKISKVSLYTLSGSVEGLDTDILNLELVFTPNSDSGFVPSVIINREKATYSVQLEPNINYDIEAKGVNDFQVTPNQIELSSSNIIKNLVFAPKPTFPINIETQGLSQEQNKDIQWTFINLNEAGYSYTFNNLENIELRNGVYQVTYSGLDAYPLEMGLTSNLIINGTSVTKTIKFNPVTLWSFDDKVINSGSSVFYKGIELTGNVATNISSGHLLVRPGSSIIIPIKPNHKVKVSYYYYANFSIEGGETIITNSKTTSLVETAEYLYTSETEGTVTIDIAGAETSYFTEIKIIPNVEYSETITVGADKQYKSINDALATVSYMHRPNDERVTILIDSGNYEEMLVINENNVTLKNASAQPNTKLTNKGVDITNGAVRITSYYGHGYNYYSMGNNQKWNDEVLQRNLQNGTYSYTNTGAGTTNGSYWNATVVVDANGFEAENIIFENSFNQYISLKESQDILVEASGSKGIRPTTVGNTSVQNRAFVERAAAIAFANNADKAILNQCRIVGRQDTFYGGTGARIVVYKGDVMGAVDYIFGGMTAVFYQTNLAMNTSEQSTDVAYITAAQQTSGRGYLMYETTVTSAEPLVETASMYKSKPGYFGRPWRADTSEVVFYNTTIETSDFPAFIGESLILPLGWQNSLGGISSGMYEYGTVEQSGIDNSSHRASWATMLSAPILNDGTAITTYNFTKGNDGWDPIPQLVAGDVLSTQLIVKKSDAKVFSIGNQVFISNIKNETQVQIYNMSGNLVKLSLINKNADFQLDKGIYIVVLKAQNGIKSTKVLSR